MPAPYDTFLFDLDGTLLDTIPLIKESMRHALRHHLAYVPDELALVRGVGTPLIEQVRTHCHDAGRPIIDEALVAQIAQTYIDHNLAGHDAQVAPYPGVVETLDRLRATGARLGIVTSKPQATARRGLRVCGLEDHFELVVGMDDVTRHKPDPEPVLFALSRLGVGPERAVFVGDSPHDMRSGRAAGVATGAALWGPFSRADLEPSTPTHWLDDVRTLLAMR
jgi:pyrophosphatase PpaX